VFFFFFFAKRIIRNFIFSVISSFLTKTTQKMVYCARL